MATEADLIQKFKDLNIPVGADFEELIHTAFAGANLADLVNNYDSRIATVETDLATKADDSKVVHDNKDGTEQLNGVQVQPYNKLVDTIGGRNLLTGTSDYSNNWELNVTSSIDTRQIPAILHYPSNTLTSGNSFVAQQHIGTILQSSTTYTASFYAKGSGKIALYCFPDVASTIISVNGVPFSPYASDIHTGIPLTSSYKLYTITFTTVSSISGDKTFLLRQDYDSSSPTVEAYVYGMKLEKGSIATDWTPAPEDKADDSKVAHLSGANNFDTVPTVKNNPLLLASSLPSDLARTGQDTNFTGKLQKSGIDVATKTDVTTAVSTVTENMADTTKATNFTAGLKSGGVDVATAADLKSIEDQAWRVLDFKNIVNDQGVTPNIDNTSVFLYKLDEINKRIYMLFTLFGTFPTMSNLYFNFSNVVKNISFPTFEKYGFYINIPGYTSYPANDIKNNKLHISIANATSEIASLHSAYFDAGWHDFPCFVGYDELV